MEAEIVGQPQTNQSEGRLAPSDHTEVTESLNRHQRAVALTRCQFHFGSVVSETDVNKILVV